MSTYYYLICDDHKEQTAAASRTFGGYCPLVPGEQTLVPFIIAHCGCRVRIISEHHVEPGIEDYREWEAETVAEEIKKADREERWN